MRYRERDELVAGLRELADFIEAKGVALPELDVTASAWVYDYDSKTYESKPGRAKRIMATAAKVMGKADKKHDGSYFDLKKMFGPVVLSLTTDRQNVCKRVVTGKKVIPAEIVPERVKEERIEEIVEWVCDEPLLAMTD